MYNYSQKISTFLLASLLGTPSSLFGVIHSISIHQKGNKTICFLGDLHHEFYRQDDPVAHNEERDKGAIIKLIEDCSTHHEPVSFVLEASDHEISRVAALQEKYHKLNPSLRTGTLYALPFFAQEHHKKYGNVQFNFADMQGRVLRDFNDIHHDLTTDRVNPTLLRGLNLYLSSETFNKEAASNPTIQPALIALQNKQGFDSLDALLASHARLRNYFFGNTGRFRQYLGDFEECMLSKKPATELIQDIEATNQLIAQTTASETTSAPISLCLQKEQQVIAQATQKVRDFFATANASASASTSEVVFQAIKNRSFGYHRDQYAQWLGDLLRSIGNVGFLINLHQTLALNKNIVFYCGIYHLQSIREYIAKEGFTDYLPIQGFVDRFTTPQSRDFRDSEIQNHLASIRTALRLSPLKKCALCAKQPEKLLRCSACKKICYCSAECQRKDWPAHKTNCQNS